MEGYEILIMIAIILLIMLGSNSSSQYDVNAPKDAGPYQDSLSMADDDPRL
jgi:hypothetical protein